MCLKKKKTHISSTYTSLEGSFHNTPQTMSLTQLVKYRSMVYFAEVEGSVPGWTNTQGLKIIEEKVLPL